MMKKMIIKINFPKIHSYLFQDNNNKMYNRMINKKKYRKIRIYKQIELFIKK
jgi:hypothetical protein